MGLDPSIILGVQQYDPTAGMGKALQLRQLAQQGSLGEIALADAQKKQAEDTKLADLYRGAINPQTGGIDNSALLRSMAGAGLGTRIPGVQKSLIEADKARADLGHVNAQTGQIDYAMLKQRTDAVNNALASLLSKPTVTHDDVIGSLSSLVSQGLIKPEEGAAAARQLPGDPAQLRPFLMQHALQGVEAGKRLDAIQPKLQTMNLGGSEQVVDMNPNTNPGIVGQAFQRTQSPDSAASSAVTMRGQDMTDARAGIPAGYRRTPDGALQAIPGGPHDPNTKLQQSSQKVLPLLDQAEGLLKQATGSYIGSGADMLAQAFGKSTKGAQATAQLKALEGALMMAQPRMEGPQSDKDVALYRQMAGQIGDSTVPVETRLAAIQTVRQLQQKYAAQNGGEVGVAPATAAPAPSAARGASGSWGGAQQYAPADLEAEARRRGLIK